MEPRAARFDEIERKQGGSNRRHELLAQTKYDDERRSRDDSGAMSEDEEYWNYDEENYDEDRRSSNNCCIVLFECIALCCGCADPGDLADGTSIQTCGIMVCTLILTGVLLSVVVYLSTLGRTQTIRNDALEIGESLRSYAGTPRWVDVVYTWVNGTHPEVERQLVEANRHGRLPYRAHSSRFRDDGLLEFALRSLLAADALMSTVRHVYIVTSGEIPSWLPSHRLEPVGSTPLAEQQQQHHHRAGSSLPGTPQQASCHTRNGFTRTTLSMPLEPLVAASGGHSTATWHAAFSSTSTSTFSSSTLSSDRKLFVVPHSAIFPEPSRELPTFNSNSILCALHRIPSIGRWFLYSDDDSIITNRNVTLSAWWDTARTAQKYTRRGSNPGVPRGASQNGASRPNWR